MSSSYSENALIEQPAIALFSELGWETANCFHETFSDGRDVPPDGDVPAGRLYMGRGTSAEVVLVPRLRKALERLNPGLSQQAIDLAIEELTRDRIAMSPMQANREIYRLLKNGVKVPVCGSNEEYEETIETVRVIDWNEPSNNNFFLASQFWVSGEIYKRRADLVGFVNGLPLVFIKLKAMHKRLEHAYKHNLRDYKNTIPHIFWYNAFIILSNGSLSRIGSITAEWEHFSDWKKINSEGEEGIISLETMIRGTCEPNRLLDIVENFTLFSETQGGMMKMVAKNHQYLGVNKTVEALRQIKENKGRLGVFWMYDKVQKYLEEISGSVEGKAEQL